MYESMTYRFDGNEENYSSCKVQPNTKIMIKYKKKLWPILVPAAAVIPEQLALFGVIGCKGCVDEIHGMCY